VKVKELMQLLSTLNPEHLVILSKDAEGNCFSPLADHGIGQYTPETTWSGEWRHEGDDEDGCSPDETNCVTLWPVN
jgi:hypothetical protein